MTVSRHPVMGFLAGVLLGMGVCLMLFAMGVVPVSVLWLGGLTLAGAVLGVALAYAVPARGRRTSPGAG